MAQAQRPQEQVPGPEPPTEDESLSRDTVYKMLANKRRRYAVHYLKHQDDTITLGALAEQVGAWEQETEPNQLSSSERKTVYTALQQRHLPKMDQAGLVTFDKRAGTVEPTESLTELDIYAEVVPSGGFPWSQYYLGLSTVSVALMVAVATGVYPLQMLPDIAWGIFIAVSFTVSAIVHVVMTREMKLGTQTAPPEKRGD